MSPPRPTALGVKGMAFYGMLLCAYFAAPYANLLFLLLVFLSVAGLAGLGRAVRGLRGFGPSEVAAESMPAEGGGAILCRSKGGFAIPGLVLELRFERGAPMRIPCAGTGASILSLRLPPLPRGVYALEMAFFATAWPFGLFEMRSPAKAPPRIVVYPAPADLAAWREAAGGGSDPRDGGGGLEPAGLRDYREGDEPRRIHWRASARRSAPVVKECEPDGASGREAVLDLRQEPEAFERSLSLLAALALEAREAKSSLLLHSQSGSVQYGAGGAPFDDLLEFLAAAAPLPAGGPPPPSASPAVPRFAGGAAR